MRIGVCFCIGISFLHGTYSHNRNGPNNRRCNDKCSAREKGYEGDLSFQVNVDSPEERERDGQEVDICEDVEDHDDDNIDARVGWLTKICADIVR
jgi:hypothetical protein